MNALRDFFWGMIAGVVVAVTLGAAVIYILNMKSIIAVSVISIPSVQHLLGWAYANLRLSIIAFALTACLFIFHLAQLRRLLAADNPDIQRIAQIDHLLDIWINLFFGIGVIWTAIGMRAALLQSIGGLDADTAARLGAFAILKRLVDGGILLALSTTIFGGAGGYLMRVAKSVLIGGRLRDCYRRMGREQSGRVLELLASIDRRLSLLCRSSAHRGQLQDPTPPDESSPAPMIQPRSRIAQEPAAP
jgi:hypothetical protein